MQAHEAMVFERAAEVFSVLSSSARLRILSQLCDREMRVGEVAAVLGIPQPAASQQLAVMFLAGLLARRREGAQVYYRVEPGARDFLCGALHALVQVSAAPR